MLNSKKQNSIFFYLADKLIVDCNKSCSEQGPTEVDIYETWASKYSFFVVPEIDRMNRCTTVFPLD